MRSSGMPMPLSRTSMCSSCRSFSTSRDVTATTTSPTSVNFTALLSRLARIWRNRLGYIVFNQVGQIEPFLGGAWRQQVERGFEAIAQIEWVLLEVELTRLDL